MKAQEDEVGEGRKYCPRCQEYKRLEEFGRHAKRPDGLQPWCRTCRRYADKERRGEVAQAKLKDIEEQLEGDWPFPVWWELQKRHRQASRSIEYSDTPRPREWDNAKVRERYIWHEIKRDAEHRGGDPNQIYADALRILEESMNEADSADDCDAITGQAIRQAIKRDVRRRLDFED